MQELINIIAEKNDRRLKVLFQNADREESCSTMMHLYPTSDQKVSLENPYKIPKPWK